MTIDEVLFRLARVEMLKNRKMSIGVDDIATLPRTPDGRISGKAADGTPISWPMGGESVASQLAREAREREASKLVKQSPRRRRK